MAKADDPRKLLAESWSLMSEEEHEELREMAKESWKEAFAATRRHWGYCPECRHKVEVDFPDFINRAKALEIFANQAWGKVPERKVVDFGEMTLEAIDRLSTVELARLGGFEIVDGEIVDAEWSETPELPAA